MKKIALVLILIAGILIGMEYKTTLPYLTGGKKVYLTIDSNLFGARRYLPDNNNKYYTAFALLKAGPGRVEKMMGISTAIPESVNIIDINVDGDTIYLDFVDEFEKWQGTATEVRLAVAQIIYTYTEFPGIKKVAFIIEGRKKMLVLGGEGYIIDRPLGRDDINVK